MWNQGSLTWGLLVSSAGFVVMVVRSCGPRAHHLAPTSWRNGRLQKPGHFAAHIRTVGGQRVSYLLGDVVAP